MNLLRCTNHVIGCSKPVAQRFEEAIFHCIQEGGQMNRRRRLVVAMGAATFAAPIATLAQQPKVWRVGFLSQNRAPDFSPFAQGMRELGYVEGKNLIIEWRSAEGDLGRLPALAADLVKMKVDAIVAVGVPPVSAAQKATTLIPIVFVGIGDPVTYGFVKSLARPEANLTGLANLNRELRGKMIEMLHEMAPTASRLAVLMNPANRAHVLSLDLVEAAARARKLKVVRAEAQTPQEIDQAFKLMHDQKADILLVSPDPFFAQQRKQIVELAAKHRLPSIAGTSEYAEAGVLMSYGTNRAGEYRRAAIYADKIIKGRQPADLPVEQPVKYELVINGKTAKALGLTIPQSLLISAERVIE